MKFKKEKIIVWFIFAVIAGILISFELRPNFPDPDSFYHAKMALLIRDQGFIQTFPWLKETVLNENFVDHHLLYHLLLIPFVTVFNPLVGIKVAAAAFGLAAFYALYRLLRALKTPGPEWLTLAAALSTNFIFRMALPRAPSLSLVFLLFGAWALLTRKKWASFFGAAAFVWLYNGWPLLLVVLAAIGFGRVFGEFAFSEDSLLKSVGRTMKREAGLAGLLLAGLGWGLISHPYFPQNIIFSFLHIVKIGFFNATNDIPVGQEWYPPSPLDFFQYNLPAVALFVVGGIIAGLAMDFKKCARDRTSFEQTLIMLALAGAFVVMTIKSVRYFEYSIPFIILAAASLLRLGQPFLQDELIPKIKKHLSRRRMKITTATISSLTIITLILGLYQNTQPDDDYYQSKQYEGAMEWIKNNLPAGETVFHNIWDYSTILWYLDDSHNYLVGLDPMFMFEKNPGRFRLWQGLAGGTDSAVDKITSEFGARVVVVDKRDGGHDQLLKNLRDTRNFVEVYDNQWLHLFAANELAL
jgi:hypothetical protein